MATHILTRWSPFQTLMAGLLINLLWVPIGTVLYGSFGWLFGLVLSMKGWIAFSPGVALLIWAGTGGFSWMLKGLLFAHILLHTMEAQTRELRLPLWRRLALGLIPLAGICGGWLGAAWTSSPQGLVFGALAGVFDASLLFALLHLDEFVTSLSNPLYRSSNSAHCSLNK